MALPKGYKYDYKKSVEARKIENAVPEKVLAKVRKLWLQGLGYAKVAEQVNLNSNQIETIIGRLKTKNIKGVKRITQKDIQNIESEIRYTKDGKAYKIIKGKTVFQPAPALETAANEAVELFKDYKKIKVYPSSIWKDLVKKHKVNRSSLSQLFKEKTNYDLRKDFTKTKDKKFVKAAVDYSKLTDEQKKKFGTKAKILNKVLGKESTLRDRQRLWRITSEAGIDVKEELPPSKYKQDRPRIIKKQSSRLIEGTLGTGKGMSKKVIDVSAKKGSLLDLMHLSGKTSPIKVGELGFGPRAINQLLGGRLAGPKETRGKGSLPEPERYRNQLERHMEKIAKNYKNKSYYRIQTTPDSIDQRLFKNVLQRLFGKTAGKIPLKEYLDKVVNEEARLFGQTTEGLIPVQLLDPDTLTKTLPVGRDPTTTLGYGTEIETEPLKGLEKEYRKEGWRKMAAEKASGEMGPTTQKFATLETEAQNKFLYTLLNSQKKIHTDQNKIKAVARNIEEMAKQGFINAADADFNNIRNLAAQCSKLRLASAGGGRIGMAQGDPCSAVVKAIKELPPEKYAVAAEKLPEMSFVQKIFSKIPKGGRLGMAAATLGAVGLGAGTLFGGSEAKAEEVFQEPGTTELEAQDIQIDQPASMAYNATEGNFVNAEGEKESQPGVLNWIAENPTKSSLAAMPLMMGAGFALDAGSKFGNESVARRGLGRAGRYLTGWKALIPAMMIPHALHEYKAGYDLPEMVTNPVNALWALGIRGKKDLRLVEEYYKNLKAGQRGLDLTTLKGLKSVEGWKRLPKDFQTAMMSPAAKGTNMAFGTTFRKPFVKTMGALDGIAKTEGAKAFGKRALLRAALIPAGILAATPAGWLTAGFLGADFLWDQYKDYRDGNIRIDEMRARGSISEDEADNYRSLILQGSIPFGIGNRMFGPDTMNIGGQDLDPTQQRELLKGMESQLDEWQAGDMERRSKFREDHFEEGGRVGFKTGGMDRRTFLKWLGALAAGATGIFKGKSKDVVKPLVADATKTIPAKFIGVEGMPAWFPRAVAKIKAHGKLIEMADKHYVHGDIYEMMIPVQRTYSRGPRGEGKEIRTEYEKVIMEDNPLSGEISMHWTGTDNFGDDAVRQINFRPGSAGYQKFGVDDPDAAAQGITEYRRVKVEEPEFTYSQPDQSQPYRDDVEFLDILTEGDEIVGGLEKMTGTKQMVTKDGTVIDVSPEGKGVDEAFQKKIYKDIEGEEAIIPEPENVGITKEGDVYGEEQYNEIIEGVIPDHLKKKAEGGIIETGNIAREPGLVPPLSGPTPQGEGIVGLFSNPKQVNVGS